MAYHLANFDGLFGTPGMTLFTGMKRSRSSPWHLPMMFGLLLVGNQKMAIFRLYVASILLLLGCVTIGEANYASYKDPRKPLNGRIKDLMSRMTLAEKIGQMAQVDRVFATPDAVKNYFIGSLISAPGSSPRPQATAEDWIDMVNEFQEGAMSIPMILGIDAIHGHNNAYGATIFPHSVGLGDTRDPDLVKRIGQATALEVRATGIPYTFASCVVCRDPRWGRCYESFGEDTLLVEAMTYYSWSTGRLATKLKKGCPFCRWNHHVAACAKHYVGDGGTHDGINEGNTITGYRSLLKIHMDPYYVAVYKGVSSIMVSFSSFNGKKMHADHGLVTDYLKNTLKFRSFVISDWQGIDKINSSLDANYTYSIYQGINAGIDLVMIPWAYSTFIDNLTYLVKSKAIPMSRIDDAVYRILRVQFTMGLFENPYADHSLINELRSQVFMHLYHPRKAPKILVAGTHANNLGYQCGGWTIQWQGVTENNATQGTTILNAVKSTVSPNTKVVYEENPDPDFVKRNGFSYAIVVFGEIPYAESFGDNKNLTIIDPGPSAIQNVCISIKCVVIIISGRPVVIEPYVSQIDALVVAWLPGTEGQGVADVLFGDHAFTGKLPWTWFKSVDQLPMNVGDKHHDPLFPFGFGLTTSPAEAS